MIKLVWGYRSAAYDALKRAETKKGSPPNILEVYAEWNSMIPNLASMFVYMALLDLYRADEILCDKMCDKFSLNPAMQSTPDRPSDFELYSDRVTRLFPTYVLDDRLHLRPGHTTPRLNLLQMRELLLSRDLTRNAELEWV